MTQTITSTAAYTYTLASGKVLEVQSTASFGDVIISGLLLAVVAVLIFDIAVKVAYRK